jgi:hypothetical protein
VAGARGQLERAARLLGATDALCAATRCPLDRPFHDPAERQGHVSALRAGLGEKTFAAVYAEGKGWSSERAVAAALEDSAVPVENERSL